MATSFPTSLDVLTNPTSADTLASPDHAAQHANVNDAVEAIEAAIGTTAAPVLAKLASPTFTGTPAAPTAAVGTNTTQIATTAFVQANPGPSFGLTSGLYYQPMRTSQTFVTPTLQTTYYLPISIGQTQTFDRIAITSGTHVGTAVVRLGIYNNDSTTGKPSTVVLDAGTVSVSGAAGTFEITISQSLSVGNYWLAFNQQTAPTSGTYANNAGLLNLGFIISTTGLTINAGAWLEASISGAFATAGTLTSAQGGLAVALRAS